MVIDSEDANFSLNRVLVCSSDDDIICVGYCEIVTIAIDLGEVYPFPIGVVLVAIDIGDCEGYGSAYTDVNLISASEGVVACYVEGDSFGC